MRYKQDFAEFIPIADGARLIQERAGLSEDESREDIVLAVRERALESQWWCTSRGERSRRFRDDLPHGFLDNLSPDLIDWDRSIARRRGVGAQFKAEIEVSRAGVCHLWPDLSGTPPKQEDGRRAAGRPSQRAAITTAFKTLVAEGEVNFGAPKTALYEPIRQEVRKQLNNPGLGKGLGKEAIRMTIGPLFDVEKAKRGPSAKS